MKHHFAIWVCLLICLPAWETAGQTNTVDVLSYAVRLEPNFQKKSISGEETIVFLTGPAAREAAFDCGGLTVNDVRGQSVEYFRQENGKLLVVFDSVSLIKRQIQLTYTGTPERGVTFLPGSSALYTVYFTNEWMVCNFNVSDRAAIRMDLVIPEDLDCVGVGMPVGKKEVDGHKTMHSWAQEIPAPAYTFGFAAGAFKSAADDRSGVALNFYSDSYSPGELDSIFKPTADMLAFFEEKSGMPYFQTQYAQILMGNHYQEMTGFAVLKGSYGKLVLSDSTETNLIAHELAHQWWGNMITCADLGHFWLNEGFATFMSAAYNEHRFGREKYLENINAYREVYEKVKAKGADKPLVFDGWANPSQDDRNLVYFKGAYVLHVLRETLGEEDFWKGIRAYSRQYYGKPVTTRDFQQAMERATGRDLQEFFAKWID
ncbi:MAG TPA: M1 family aminopeptidase [Flavilitoribacter sp.]|nr:M1 family aminopeptidase [Flavilitoribacter sp.]HMQ91059.1 M1 family aminopeptidase [Flavilitoribacter sp.]